MDTLVFKLIATPLLVQAAGLAARRWGQAVGGWLVGLPLTSGPVALFLALERGPDFAAAAAGGALGGAAAQAAFCVAYGAVARRAAWPPALAAATLAFALAALLLQSLALPLAPLLVLVLLALTLALLLLGKVAVEPQSVPAPPRWDMPARIVVATTLVLALTEAAPLLGARLSGVLGTYPIFATVLAVFAHRSHGAEPAQLVLRGLLLGLFSFAAFFLALGLALERLGIAASFALAIVAALAVQGLSLRLIRRPAA